MAEIDPREPGAAFDAYSCPECDFGLVGVEGEPTLLHCPRCDKHFRTPDAVDDAPAPEPDDRADELSALRIRQLSAAKRAAYRSRSYCVIAAVVCVVAIVQLVWNGVLLLRGGGWTSRPVSYFLFAILAAWGVGYFVRHATAFHREAQRSALPEPTTPPDFSTLGDGSEQWKKLEDVR